MATHSPKNSETHSRRQRAVSLSEWVKLLTAFLEALGAALKSFNP